MVKEKGNYKYRSPCMAAEFGMVLRGLGHLMGDDQWKPGGHVPGARISVL